jgi:hypothetical protein
LDECPQKKEVVMATQLKVPSRFGSTWRVGLTDSDQQALIDDENLSVDPPVFVPCTMPLDGPVPRLPSAPPGTPPLAAR